MYINRDIDYMKYLYNKKILIFGAGQYGRKLAKRLIEKNYNVEGFIDNDISKKGTIIDSCKVFGTVSDTKKMITSDMVVVIGGGGDYEREMKQELLDNAIPYILGTAIDFGDSNESAYGEEYYKWQLKISKFNAKFDIEQFAPHIKETDTVIEFGSAEGFLLEKIIAKEKIGVEINDFAREYAKKKSLNCVKSLDEIPDEFADVVISTHVLEHVDNPLEVIREIKNKLKDGGKAIFIVPYEKKQQDYEIHNIDQHLYTWNCLHLGNLFKRAGYFVKEVRSYYLQWPPHFEEILENVGRDAFLELSKLTGSDWQKENVLIVAVK